MKKLACLLCLLSTPAFGQSAPFSAIVPNNTTGVLVKSGGGAVDAVQLFGLGAAPAYVKFYDTPTAPTCGTGTPVLRLGIPAASTATNGGGSNVTFGPGGLRFLSGLGYCVTTGITDADATAPAASTFIVNIAWH